MKRLVGCQAILGVLLLLLGLPAILYTQTAEVRFLDVGQADAVLIRSQGKVALVDAGGGRRTTEQLQRLGVEKIDLMILSHPHADHIGGARDLLERLSVQNFMDNGVPHTTATYRTVMGLVEAQGIPYLQATPRTITLGQARLTIIPPPEATRNDRNLNNQSIGVLVEVGGFRAFLSGDSEVEQINAWLQIGAVPQRVTVLKAAHHGARNGVTPAWLSTLRPQYVVISSGAGNRYGHPHETALRYYKAGGRKVLRTDQGGDVAFLVEPDGQFRVTRGAREEATRGEPRGVWP